MVFHCNYGCILYRFRNKARCWSKTPIFHTPCISLALPLAIVCCVIRKKYSSFVIFDPTQPIENCKIWTQPDPTQPAGRNNPWTTVLYRWREVISECCVDHIPYVCFILSVSLALTRQFFFFSRNNILSHDQQVVNSLSLSLALSLTRCHWRRQLWGMLSLKLAQFPFTYISNGQW